jgi:hypothetical protein
MMVKNLLDLVCVLKGFDHKVREGWAMSRLPLLRVRTRVWPPVSIMIRGHIFRVLWMLFIVCDLHNPCLNLLVKCCISVILTYNIHQKFSEQTC